ncbi:hypothetical protein [uncultured Apibacter sp.]|uniref:hypothetical protein n=1 Tax=uncultured Apibacter sp. TaxID=1778616 RepID=UPI0025D2593F|nr:hypothetical protein [uncultured Apibacter sp.]
METESLLNPFLLHRIAPLSEVFKDKYPFFFKKVISMFLHSSNKVGKLEILDILVFFYYTNLNP